MSGADPGKMKGGASRKGRSPVQGCNIFYNLLTIWPLNFYINEWILNTKKLIQKTRSNQQFKDWYCIYIVDVTCTFVHALLVYNERTTSTMPTQCSLVRGGKAASLQLAEICSMLQQHAQLIASFTRPRKRGLGSRLGYKTLLKGADSATAIVDLCTLN